jgi:hypothetical protein
LSTILEALIMYQTNIGEKQIILCLPNIIVAVSLYNHQVSPRIHASA